MRRLTFPLKLASLVIETSGAQSIFDPYSGSGTTLVAAKLANIQAVGIERSKAYCEMTVRGLRPSCFPRLRHPSGPALPLGGAVVFAATFSGSRQKSGGVDVPAAVWAFGFHSAAVQLFSIQRLISSTTDSSGPVVLLLPCPSTYFSVWMPGNSVRMMLPRLSTMRSASCWVHSLP